MRVRYHRTVCGAKGGERARTLLANNVHEEKVYTIQNVLVKLVQVRKRPGWLD